ncbi:hypothetical protein N7452_008894 [Penicillium brevicompactum]|uniref:Uncharacterized protein n=1 Tax=Penicillium brevicompactum TaxID=5074 RepID=A0A9W9UAP1_PENBR|nr:hypothetical protein N7452_008894 [Penicillium brevicompactum]
MDADLPGIGEIVVGDNSLSTPKKEEEAKHQGDKPVARDANKPLSPEATEDDYDYDQALMCSMRHWRIRDAPDRAGLLTPERWVKGKITWEPSEVRLTDAGCVFALLMLSPEERTTKLPFDFNAHGDVRRSRVTKPPTVVVVPNNLRFFIAWRDTYVFTGGHNLSGWLLQPQYPEKQSSFEKGWLRAGLMLAPTAVKSSSGAGGLDCTLSAYEPSKPSDIPLTPGEMNYASTWLHGRLVHGVPLRGTQPESVAAATVLHVEGQVGYIAMAKIPGFSPVIQKNTPKTRPSTWEEIANCEDFHPIDWDAIPTPPRKQKTTKDTEGEKGRTKQEDSASNKAVLPSLDNRTWVNVRSDERLDLHLTPLFANVIDIMTQSGAQKPELIQAITSLCVAKMAIDSEEVALGVLRRSPRDDQRQRVYTMLTPNAPDTETWMTEIVDAVGNDDNRRNAVIDALHYRSNLNYLEEAVTYMENEDTLEATLCRSLLSELKR